jgi:hypothetical protein
MQFLANGRLLAVTPSLLIAQFGAFREKTGHSVVDARADLELRSQFTIAQLSNVMNHCQNSVLEPTGESLVDGSLGAQPRIAVNTLS